MFWVVQNNLWNEMNFMNVIDCLVRQEIPHEIVKVIPFADEIAGENNEPDETWSPPSNMPVYVCGGTTLAKIARKKGWTPGAFLNDNFDSRVQNEKWGEHMLNYSSVTTSFGNAHCWMTGDSEYFIRPVLDDKSFAGHMTNFEKTKIWQKKVIKLKDVYTSLNEETQVLISNPKEIHREYRFFIVDQKIAASSLYKLGDRVVPRNDFLDDDLRYFVHKRIWEWTPDRAFVMDVADTPEGYKIIECNCINSSGFYASDVYAMVQAIEGMVFHSKKGIIGKNALGGDIQKISVEDDVWDE